MPVEGALKLGAIVSLDDVHGERKLLEHIVQELDRRPPVIAIVDSHNSDAGALRDGDVLVVLGSCRPDGLDEPSRWAG
jgi:hypothetical protein